MLWIMIAAVIVVGGGSFYGGMLYQASKQPAGGAGNFQRQGQGGVGGNNAGANGARRSGANFVSGQILAKDDKSITVKLNNGGSKIAFIASSTQVMKAVNGTDADLAVGANVMVTGQTNPDGSLTAQKIQLRQDMPGGSNGGQGGRQ